MYPTIHRPAARRALALGFVAGAWLIPSASMAGAETYLPTGAAAVTAETSHIQLVQAEVVPDEMPVSYTAEQADRGQKQYDKECVDCHGKDLGGGLNGGPPLRGLAFEEKFGDGNTASTMFLFMSSLMPPNSPGRYSESTYADLMAYILKRNGYQPGAPLPSDAEALDYLIMEK